MEGKKLERLELSYKILSVIGWLGLIDVVTRSLSQGNGVITDMGYVSITILYILKFLFGTEVAATITVIFSMIFGLSIIYLICAWDIKRRINKIKNPTNK